MLNLLQYIDNHVCTKQRVIIGKNVEKYSSQHCVMFFIAVKQTNMSTKINKKKHIDI